MNSNLHRNMLSIAALVLVFVATGFCQNAPYQVKIQRRTFPETDSRFTLGVSVNKVDSSNGLAAFDLRIKYDTLSLILDSVTPGQDIQDCGWDQFTFEPDTDGSVRIIGAALAGGDGPSCLGPVYGVGAIPLVLCSLYFSTTDSSCGGNCIYSPLRWYWKSCGDNVLMGVDSTIGLTSAGVFVEYYPDPLDVADSSVGYPTFLGTQGGCPVIGETTPTRAVDLLNGGIDIVCTDESDGRGDINLNSIAYEPADIDLLRQYLLVGSSAFTLSVPGQLAASDISGDGREAFVGDYVRGVLVLVGDMGAITLCDSLPTTDAEGEVGFLLTNNDLSVSTEVTLGGIWLMVNRNVIPGTLDSNFTLDWNYDGTVTRILVTGKRQFQPASIESGFLFSLHPFEEIDNDYEIVDIQACDTIGRFTEAGLQVVTGVEEEPSGSLPGAFELHQNVPNPFNPVTQISFVLPATSSPVFEVFDIMGRLVKRVELGMLQSGQHEVVWKGDNDNGQPVASGVYLYRLTAGEYQASKKCVLLK